ncbi:multidrug resistance-associated protein 1, putative [Plasmodium knowlesi strain H]|uniref:Multidrug resistance-associated protein 1, putative n=3 Tax=Plasmodium knowlesi TaxID=5850 RepID=A0A5K1U1L5_PLAKH|nr:ABC transporter C family member 2, putative [Plasmodium knowlesi strain H]OTN64081.1 putative Multidrug resistance-associated protein 1 [Plasmodium knowlesi]CAA9991080.1 ABC transporter C family member 2, putative [Plasmodium knowlesi strain H]SBO20625.1 multidrug resistance-associated protein 1, putative [Plasmodium knowlesi strain H]SBO21033.1 multidrug resistance-associated protein 1, putative [Plasmodium knowlesi strain H]VVS80554.1 ABC transporter C family member 2, putative [Plasmodiu|eukprot:XP_002262362.1 transporter, putative [Plasmodium knowlesi strain H]
MNGKNAKGKDGARKQGKQGSLIASMSWFGFITFEWITIILNKLKAEDNFTLPKVEEDAAIEYYAYNLGNNLRGFKKRRRKNDNSTVNSNEGSHKSSLNGMSNTETSYSLQKRGIIFALLKTFKNQLSCITFFYVIHTLYLIFVALCIENYILLIRGEGNPWIPFLRKHKEIAFGLFLIGVICFDLFFDAILTFFDYRLRLNMEITLMYFLYKINLENFRGTLSSSPYIALGDMEDTSPMLKGEEDSPSPEMNRPEGETKTGDDHSVKVEGVCSDRLGGDPITCSSIGCQAIPCDPIGCEAVSGEPIVIDTVVEEKGSVGSKGEVKISDDHLGGESKEKTIKREILSPRVEVDSTKVNGESNEYPDEAVQEEDDKRDNDSCDINIYNIMFVDTPFLIYFISSIIDFCNMVIKFTISFYMFYYKMGREAVVNGILLIAFLYSLMFAFELASSVFKIRHLRCRDSRINNMHHILKEYKLMKMFNWESIAFDYVNRHRKKEMKVCTIRIYLNSLSNYINAISMNVVEVAIFFIFIRGELNSNKPINVSSIITPLFLYKSLIAGMSNLPNIINNLLEGAINIGRINRYIEHYMFQFDREDRNGYCTYRNDHKIGIQTCSTFGRHNKMKSNSNKHCDDSNWRSGFYKYFFFNKGYGMPGKGKSNTNGYYYRSEKGNDALGGVVAEKVTGRLSGVSIGGGKGHQASDVILKMNGCYFSPDKSPTGKGRHSRVDSNQTDALLKNVNLTLKNNTLVVILGNVGSGKTLFFNSLFGKLKLSQGNCYIKNFVHDMPVMYVPQFYWVTIGTIRSMIIFGNRFDPYLYYRAIVQSELINDMNTFKKKDLRYVGDEHSLSKGQKARICLARALYHHYIHMSDLLIDYEKDIRINKEWREKVMLEKLYGTDNSSCKEPSGVRSDSSMGHHEREKGKNILIKGEKVGKKKEGTYDEPLSQEEKYQLHDAYHSTNDTLNETNMINASLHGSPVKSGKYRKEEQEGDQKQNGRGSNGHVIIGPTGEMYTENNNLFKKNSLLKECLEQEQMSYLYLLDDLFCALDPCISKNIFYNLFCSNDDVEGFKRNCAFVLTANQNIWNSFLDEDIIRQLQYGVEIYRLEDRTLVYEGDIHTYMKNNGIVAQRGKGSKEGSSPIAPVKGNTNVSASQTASSGEAATGSSSSSSTSRMLDFFSEQQSGRKYSHKNDMKFQKFVALKELKSTYSCRIEPLDSPSVHEFGRKYTTVTQNYVEMPNGYITNGYITNGYITNAMRNVSISSIGSLNKTMINSYAEVLIKEKKNVEGVGNDNRRNRSFDEDDKITLHEFEKVSKVLQAKLKQNYIYEYMGNEDNGDEGEEEELRFKGNIKWETFAWYLRMIGTPLIAVILFFMVISIFTDEIKNMLLFMASTLIKSKGQRESEILEKQLVYMKWFVLLPCVSLVTTLTSFMLIAHGIAISAVKVHTEVLMSILYAPIHAFYSNNLGNIINRFITDINVLDNGIIKRIYKTFYTFFRFLFTIYLLNYMVYQTIYVLPIIIFLIYVCVFQRYSRGCKEAQRGYLSAHAPLCTIYSNTILGKEIIYLYGKSKHFLDLYSKGVFNYKNYTIFKWCLTIWASLYVQLIVLCLTSFYIIYPYVLEPYLGDKKDPHFMNEEKNANTIGYCITFSCSLGFIIKSLLYDYTHVEKEMCSTQRLEECSQMFKEQVNYDDKEGMLPTQMLTMQTASTQVPVVKDTPPMCAPENGKAKYGLHFENVFVSYKKKIFIDRSRNLYYYANEKSCLRNLNLYALKGQKIGIVGRSGAGKSTTILSVLGLIPTTRGTISIEGRDIKTMTLEERKNTIGLLPQSSFVFFHWNIRTYIDPYKNFTDNEIMDAFKLIGINLQMEDLYKYIYKQKKRASQDGRRVYNGRDKFDKSKSSSTVANSLSLSDDCIRYLALVRIFLNRHNYKLVLIDEIPVLNLNLSNSNTNNFFSSDVKSFEYIIRNYFSHITVLIIAHDVSTLSCCDFIYVVAKGEVSYKCSYSDIKTQAALAALIQKQTE